MSGRTPVGALATTLALLAAASSTAFAAAPGDTFATALLPLPAGALAGGHSGRDALDYPSASAVSRDGRYVAFVAAADGLAAEAPLDTVNVFRKDRATGEIVLVSRASGAAGLPAQDDGDQVAISDDGSRVGWITNAALVPADGDGSEDVYVRDLATNETLLASAYAGPGEDVGGFDLSGDGNWIVVTSDERLAPGDGNDDDDVYRVAVAGGAPTLVSAVDGGTTAGNDNASAPSISADGTWVAFSSTATDLTSGFVDGNGGGGDVFARDVVAGRTYLVSNAATLPRQGGNQTSSSPLVAGAPASGGGTNVTIAYASYATDVAPAGTDLSATGSVYRRNLGPRFTASTLVSRATGIAGADAATSSSYPRSISDDGRLIAFATNSADLGAPGQQDRVWVRDTAASTTTLASAAESPTLAGAISGDGSVFVWNADGGITADSDPDAAGVFARSYATPPAALGAPQLVSRPPGTAPLLLPALRTEPAAPGERSVSRDGRYVLLFGHTHRDLLGLGALPGAQLYRRDTVTGALALVTRADGPAGAAVDDYVADRSISGDGQRVVFSTYASLDPSDLDGDADVYLRDLATARTTLVSRADGPAGVDADAGAQDARISADGSRVAFVTTARNLGTPGGDRHVYVRDLAAARTLVADRASGPAGALADDESGNATLSADGRLVAFTSDATNLDPADALPQHSRDVYVRDTATDTTTLVSRRSGADGAKAVGGVADAVISADGRVVAFATEDETLAPEAGGWGGTAQVVVRELATRQTTLVSRAAGGAAADADALAPTISDDGETVAFVSAATNLLPGRGGSGRRAVFARSRATGALAGPPPFGRLSDQLSAGAFGPSLSGDGRCLAFTAAGHAPGGSPGFDEPTAYLHVLAGGCPTAAATDDGDGQQHQQPPPGVPQRPLAPARPRLSKVSLLRARFRVAAAPTAVAARASRKRKQKRARVTPAGTAIRFTLDARANVTIAIERNAGRGRLVGRQCRRATRKLRKKRTCTRWSSVGAFSRRGVEPGRRSVAFSGRIGRRALAPGSYRLIVRAANASGASKAAPLAFAVVRR